MRVKMRLCSGLDGGRGLVDVHCISDNVADGRHGLSLLGGRGGSSLLLLLLGLGLRLLGDGLRDGSLLGGLLLIGLYGFAVLAAQEAGKLGERRGGRLVALSIGLGLVALLLAKAKDALALLLGGSLSGGSLRSGLLSLGLRCSSSAGSLGGLSGSSSGRALLNLGCLLRLGLLLGLSGGLILGLQD